MKTGKKIFWLCAVLLILFRVAWSLPIGEWVSSHISLSRNGMLVILILNLLLWILIGWYVKNKNSKGH